MLVDNGINYTKPHFGPRIYRRNHSGRIVKERRTSSVPYEDWVTIAINVGAPIIINKIWEWYQGKKKKGNKIVIETGDEIVEVNAEKITKIKVTKKKNNQKKRSNVKLSKNLPSYPCSLCHGKMRFCTIETAMRFAPLRNDATKETEVADGYRCEKCGHEEFAEDLENEEEMDATEMTEKFMLSMASKSVKILSEKKHSK